MKEPYLIEFDDDIIAIQRNILKNVQKLTVTAKDMFQHLYKYIEKTQYISVDLFNLINIYINLDHEGVVIFGESKNERYVSFWLLKN